jgi:hypothetical protein
MIAQLTLAETAAAAAARLLYLTAVRPLTPRQIQRLGAVFGVDRSIPAAATGRLVGRYRGAWVYDANPSGVKVNPKAIELFRLEKELRA